MRASLPGLVSPHPLGWAMPGVYHDDPVVQAFLSAFDEVLAPIFCTLDNLESYFDPMLTPPDFLEWLGGWVGMALDENWPLERRRALVHHAVELYRWRGTVRGLAAHVALHTGVEPEIEESGGLTWSSRPGQQVPGTADAFVRIRVRVPDPSAINAERLSVMIGNSLPADIIHELIVEQAIEEEPPVAVAELLTPEVEPAPLEIDHPPVAAFEAPVIDTEPPAVETVEAEAPVVEIEPPAAPPVLEAPAGEAAEPQAESTPPADEERPAGEEQAGDTE